MTSTPETRVVDEDAITAAMMAGVRAIDPSITYADYAEALASEPELTLRREGMRKAIAAYLAAAPAAPAPEPVARQCRYRYDGGEWGEWGFKRPMAFSQRYEEEVRELYATPPAPLAAREITMGLGLVDVVDIQHEGRKGILFSPRTAHLPVGATGELPAGEYWPTAGDVVIWIESSEGAQVIQKYLAPHLPAPVAASAVKTLDWFHLDLPNTVYAHSEMGIYTAWETEGEGFFRRNVGCGRVKAGCSIEAAKAAAQADYERRVRACLEPEHEARIRADQREKDAGVLDAMSAASLTAAEASTHKLDKMTDGRRRQQGPALVSTRKGLVRRSRAYRDAAAAIRKGGET